MISIITPSFNQGLYIERTIQSVLTQDIVDLEYVVIDGGSQDATLTILNAYRNQLNFVSEKDNGQSQAINKGLKITSGEIIGWINSDDIYYHNTINRVIEFFKNNPTIDVVYGEADHIDQNDKTIQSYPTEQWNIERLKQTCFLCQPAVFFRRRVIEEFGFLNENLHYCLDYQYWLHLALRGAKFGFLPYKLAGSRLHPETKTLSAPIKAQHETICMLRQELGYVPINWLIRDAIMFVKNRTHHYQISKLSYLLFVFAMTIVSAFRWNGFLNGIYACLKIPKTFLSYRRYGIF